MQRILHRYQDAEISFFEQASAAERLFDTADAGVGQLHITGELIDEVVRARPKSGDDRIGTPRERRIFRYATGDDERDAGLVDQDRIYFVDDGEGEWPLD